MGKYDDKSYNDLRAMKDEHNKKKKANSKPDESAYKEKDGKMKKSIHDYKLKMAELKYEMEQLRDKATTLRTEQRAKSDLLQMAQKNLKERQEETKAVQTELLTKLGLDGKSLPKRISNPQEKLEAFEKELRMEKQRLRSESHSIGEEKKMMRNIKILEGNIVQVKEYMKQNVEEVFVKKAQTRNHLNSYRDTHEEAFQAFRQARETADEHYRTLDENRDEQKKLQELIDKLQEGRKKAAEGFKKKQDAHQQWIRKLREISQALNVKQYDQELEPVSKPDTKKNDSRALELKKQREEEEEKRVKAQEQVKKSVEDRRAAAVAAYKQCQDNLKKKSKAPVAGGGYVAAPQASTKEEDPHQAEKDLCLALIAYCQSNLPGERQSNENSPKGKKKRRKKKKKIRLTHKPINFSNFAKVGVGIPIWSTDLQTCIKQLEERIQSYDNPDANPEEDVKDTSI